MKALFNINEYKNISIIPEISLSDVMDGTPDTMTFSFIYEIDLVSYLQLKSKCYVTIEDELTPLIYTNNTISFLTNTITIDETTYTISDDLIYLNTENVGYVYSDRQLVYINDITYYYYLNSEALYIDNRKYYNMCLSQISSELLSTNANNGYMITVNLKEQTVLLKDCVKTDLTITPSLYPLINDKQIYPTLLEAVYKICDKHNMQLLNVKILELDEQLEKDLSGVACSNLTYKDLSTFDQLQDVFLSIGKIPYFEEGKLYGLELNSRKNDHYNILNLKEDITISENLTITVSNNSIILNGTTTGYDSVVILTETLKKGIYYYDFIEKDFNISFKNVDFEEISLPDIKGKVTLEKEVYVISFHIPSGTYNNSTTKLLIAKKVPILNNYDILTNGSSLSRVRIDGVNQNVYSTKVYNTLYDNELTIVPSIFSKGINQPRVIVASVKKGTSSASEIDEWLSHEYEKWTTLNSSTDNQAKRLLSISNYNSQSNSVQDSRVYGLTLPCNIEEVTRIFICKPFVRYNSSTDYVDFGFIKTLPEFDINLNNNLVTSVSSDNTFSLSGANFSVLKFPDQKGNGEFILNNIPISNYRFVIDGVTFTILEPAPNRVGSITDSNGENYAVDMSGYFRFQNERYIAHFPLSSGSGIVTKEEPLILQITNYNFTLYDVEYSVNTNLRCLEYQYYKNLEQLQQNIFAYYQRGTNTIKQIVSLIADKVYLQGDFSWSDTFLYNDLKSAYYIVEYKPILDQNFTNYDYNLAVDGSFEEPNDVKTYNLPYKTVTDKRVYPILEYDLAKGTDKNSNIKCIFNDARLLLLEAGNTIELNNKKYIISSLSHYINNNTVETTLELNENVVSQSSISSYKDSVRVSSNLSTETTVVTEIPIYSECVVTLENEQIRNELGFEALTSDNSYFTQNLGKELIKRTYAELGLYVEDTTFTTPKTIYDFMTNYPLRFAKLKLLNNDSNYAIQIITATPYKNGVFEFNEFPIYARSVVYDVYTDSFIRDDPVVTINTPRDLRTYNSNRAQLFYSSWIDIFKGTRQYKFCEFSSDNSTWYQVRPEIYAGENLGKEYRPLISKLYGKNEGWNYVKIKLFGEENYNNTFSPYSIIYNYSGNDASLDTNQIYSTEGMFTNSNLISNYIYLLNDPSNSLTRYSSADLPANAVSDAISSPNTIQKWNADFTQTDPIYYNTSESGSEIKGFGKINDYNYNLGILQNFSQRGYGRLLDLRETPQVHLQYKTIVRNSDYYELLELGKDINWLNGQGDITTYDSLPEPVILEVPKGTKLDQVNVDYTNYFRYRANYTSLIWTGLGWTFSNNSGDIKLKKQTNLDYILMLKFNDTQKILKVCRFRLLQDYPDYISLFLNIRNSYKGIQHYMPIMTNKLNSVNLPIPTNTQTSILRDIVPDNYNSNVSNKLVFSLLYYYRQAGMYTPQSIPILNSESSGDYVDLYVDARNNLFTTNGFYIRAKAFYEESTNTINLKIIYPNDDYPLTISTINYIIYKEVD